MQKPMKRNALRIGFLAAFVLAETLFVSGCFRRVINTPAGCRNRVTNPVKRAACIQCTRRGPQYDYMPGRLSGRRCVVR